MPNGPPKAWLISGCSRGFGRILAHQALERGDLVAATARDPGSLRDLAEVYGDSVLCLEMDVTRIATVRAAIEAARCTFGHIDVVVNNAGYGLQAATEEASDEQIRALFEVNFFGAMNVIRNVLPCLRSQGSGHILNISSVAGRTSAPLIALYSASKFALEGLSIGLAMELEPFGIKVTTIEPGAFATGFADAVQPPAVRIDAYRGMHQAIEEVLAGLTFADPQGCVAAIMRAVDDPAPPRQLIAGGRAYAMVETMMSAQLSEMTKWRGVSAAADGPE
jgi:NAD(P)-dependent dehydrogenase (short-subunit alcohol dehydrogenase family)